MNSPFKVHDAVATMLHGGDSMFVVMCSVWYPPNKAKKLQQIIVSSEQRTFFLVDLGVSHMPLGKDLKKSNELPSTVAFLSQQFVYAESLPSQLLKILTPSEQS